MARGLSTRPSETCERRPSGRWADTPDVLPFCVLGFAGIAAERGQAERVGTLVGAIDAWLERAGQVFDPDDAPDFERTVERGTAADADAFEQSRAAGRAMSIEETARWALGG